MVIGFVKGFIGTIAGSSRGYGDYTGANTDNLEPARRVFDVWIPSTAALETPPGPFARKRLGTSKNAEQALEHTHYSQVVLILP